MFGRSARSLLIALALAAAACAPPAEPVAAGGSPGGGRPALVSVEEAAAPVLDRSFTVLAEVRTRHRAELAVGVDGAVVHLDVLEGQTVSRGEVLVRVDDAVLRAELLAAQAAVEESAVELARAEADLLRYQQIDRDVLAGAELDRVESEAARLRARGRSLEAQVALTRARLARYSLQAPFDGVVARRHADPGDWVTPGRVLLELASTQDLDLLADVDPALARSLSVGQAVRIATPRGDVSGEVSAIVPVLDPATRTARVRISPASDPPVLVPGDAVSVVFDTALSLDHGARVPRDAVNTARGQSQVVKMVDGAAAPTPVTLLAEAPEAFLVDGVEPGDVVVVRGNERLRPGQPLRTVDSKAP